MQWFLQSRRKILLGRGVKEGNDPNLVQFYTKADIYDLRNLFILPNKYCKYSSEYTSKASLIYLGFYLSKFRYTS